MYGTESEKPETPRDEAAEWLAQIESYEKSYEAWQKEADKITERYRDDKDAKSVGGRYNLFYSNVQTIAPAIYNNTPTPIVDRRNKSKDHVGRVASILLENAVRHQLDAMDFDYIIRCAVLDYLLSGRGVAWERYDPTMEMTPMETGEFDELGMPVTADVETKTYEKVTTDFVPFKNFGHTPAANWSDVRAVWKSKLMDDDELEAMFGEELADKIPMEYAADGKKVGDKETKDKDGCRALVYEIWDKQEKTVYWVSKSLPDQILKEQIDPLKLADFFPCPRPLFGSLPSDSLQPIPDYMVVRHQLDEIDRLTKQIKVLTDQLKLKGVYNGAIPALKRLTASDSNDMIPVTDWMGMQEKGGLKGAVDFLPLEGIVQALAAAQQARQNVKADVDEILGINDLVRGQSVASETATAQRIKGNFATMRLNDRQKDVARFVRDLIRIKAEIIAEHFDPENIVACTDLSQFSPEEAQTIPEALQLLKDERQRGFRIEIETDSTIQIDEDREKQTRNEFLTAIGGFMQQALPVVQAAPETAPIISELMLFTVRTYSKGRALESAFEAFAQQMGEMAKNAKMSAGQPKPDDQRKEREVAVKEFDAQTKRISAVGNLTPQPVVAGLPMSPAPAQPVVPPMQIN
jgi:hypothetical protein